MTSRSHDTQHPDDAELFDAAEGTLSRRASARVGDHLASCARCRELVEQARAGKQAAAGIVARPFPAERQHDLDAALDHAWTRRSAASRRGRRRGWLARRPALGAGLAAALVGMTVVGVVVGLDPDTASQNGGAGRGADTTAVPALAEGDAASKADGPPEDLSAGAPQAAEDSASPTTGAREQAGAGQGTAAPGGDQPVTAPEAQVITVPPIPSAEPVDGPEISIPRCVLEVDGRPLLPGRELSRRPLGPIGSVAVVCYEFATAPG